MSSRHDSERNGDKYCNYQRGDGEFYRRRVTLHNHRQNRTILAERSSQISGQNAFPIIDITVFRAVPFKTMYSDEYEKKKAGPSKLCFDAKSFAICAGVACSPKTVTAGSPGTSSIISVTNETTVHMTSRNKTDSFQDNQEFSFYSSNRNK